MTDIANVAAQVAPRRLPFAFANRHGVVVACAGASDDGASGDAVVHARHGVNPQALLEVRRVLGAPFVLQEHSAEEFEAILTQAYQRDSSEAKQLMEDIGNESNLFSLADELPQTEDLLESEDDAPIIKLINAMLSEAIKEGASDIHIETFEKDLLVRFRIDGVLREVIRPNRKLSSLLVSRIKVMAQLDIA